MIKLFIDDERIAPDSSWFVVRTYKDAIQFFAMNGCPNFISFDHDLGEDKSGLDVAKWLIDIDLKFNGEYIPKDFNYRVHSANIIGGKNIDEFLGQYLKFRKKDNNDD